MNNKLINAVVTQLGYNDVNDEECKQTLEGVANNGAGGGVNGFTYYIDTSKFYDDNKSLILSHAQNMLWEDVETISQLVASFNCIEITPYEVESFFTGQSDEDAIGIKNALAWYALEEVARSITEA